MYFRHLRVVAIIAISCVTATANASIQANYTGVFSTSNGGPDSLGLNLASFSFSMDYASGSVYISRFGEPVIDSTSNSLQISGSTGGADGSYVEPLEIGFYAAFPGQFFAGGPTNGFAAFIVGGQTLDLIRLTDEDNTVSVGDTIGVADFGTTLYTTATHFSNSSDGTNYVINNFSASISESVIPEPTTFFVWSLLGLTAGGITCQRRRRSRA